MGKLYTNRRPSIVFRIYDPIEDKFCATGHSLYGKGRSIWMDAGAASLAKRYMPKEIKDRLIIKKFQLIEV